MMNNLAHKMNTESFEIANADDVCVAEIVADFKMSARTSMHRKSVSAPLKFLLGKNLINGSILNYGKGRCDKDSNAIIDAGYACTNYDYTYCYQPEVLGGSFMTVYCGYVTNTLPTKSRKVVWKEMAASTRKDKGFCFVAARSDKIVGEAFDDGVKTKIGTFQKSYAKGELLEEALQHFAFATELAGTPSGCRIVMCSHHGF
jgi:hypothetical protein